jgi:hypothetical protein
MIVDNSPALRDNVPRSLEPEASLRTSVPPVTDRVASVPSIESTEPDPPENVTVSPDGIQTTSLESGTASVDQFEAVDHCPSPADPLQDTVQPSARTPLAHSMPGTNAAALTKPSSTARRPERS